MTSLEREIYFFLEIKVEFDQNFKRKLIVQKSLPLPRNSPLSRVESSVPIILMSEIYLCSYSFCSSIPFYNFYALMSNKALNSGWISFLWQYLKDEICSKEEMPACLFLFLPLCSWFDGLWFWLMLVGVNDKILFSYIGKIYRWL